MLMLNREKEIKQTKQNHEYSKDVVLGSEKEFVVNEAQTHGPGHSVPMFKSRV